jgi:hypothetical protein
MDVLTFDEPDPQFETPAAVRLHGCKLKDGARVGVRVHISVGDDQEIAFGIMMKTPDDDGHNLKPDHHLPPAAVPAVAISLRDIFAPADTGQTSESMLDWAMEKAIAARSTLSISLGGSNLIAFKLTLGSGLEYTWASTLEELSAYFEPA